MSEPYKACGRQLAVPPDAKGTPIDKWMMSAPLFDPKEIAEYRNRTRAEVEAAAKPKTKAKPSGALPGNTEWL